MPHSGRWNPELNVRPVHFNRLVHSNIGRAFGGEQGPLATFPRHAGLSDPDEHFLQDLHKWSPANRSLNEQQSGREGAPRLSEQIHGGWGQQWFEYGPLPMMAFDRDSLAIVAVNQAAILFYGYSAEEFGAMTVKDIRPPEDVPRVVEGVKAGDQGLRGPFTGRHRKKDGTLVDVEVHTQRHKLESTTVILAEVHDVTEHRRAVSKARALIETAPDAMAVVGPTGRIVVINAQLEEMFGYRREELLGHEIELLVPERFRERHLGYSRDFLGAPRIRAMGAGLELYGRRSDGSEFPVEISLSPLETEEGTYVSAAIRDISERKRREGEIQRLNLELRDKRLQLVTDAAMSCLGCDHLLIELLRRIREVLAGDTANVLLLSPDGEHLVLHASDGMDEKAEENIHVPVGRGLAGRVAASQKPLIIEDIAQLEVFSPVLRRKIRSAIGVALRVEERLIGVLHVGTTQPRAFNEEDVRLLRLVSERMALAIDDAFHRERAKSAQQELLRERDRLKLLLEINNALVSRLDIRELFVAISSTLRHLTQHECSQILLRDPETEELKIRALDFPTGKGLLHEGLVAPIEGTPFGTVFKSRQPLLIERLEKKNFPSEFTERLIGEGVRSMCVMPLPGRSGVLGILSIGSSREAAFSPAQLELKVMVANQVAIAIENALAHERIATMNKRLEREKHYLEEEVRSQSGFEEFIGESAALRRVLGQIEIVAPTNSTVLITGETGTGKELVARAIHQRGVRGARPFIKLNCAAIPTGLLESELFGHEKGAFTGAIAQKIGRLQLAHQGTLFLDEVGDIALELQPKLLRVLQEGEFEPLGSNRTHRVDVRLVAATNRDLSQMIAERQFRNDLYYRLNVFPIATPPLRDRVEDIPLLVRYFAQKYARQMNRKITRIAPGDLEALSKWRWPGNIRELENFVERAVILSMGDLLELPMAEMEALTRSTPAREDTLEAAEREQILRVLRETKGVVGGSQGAAARLGLKRTTLSAKMRRLGISRSDIGLAD